MNLVDQLREISNVKDRLWNMNLDYSNVGVPGFSSYASGYPNRIQHVGARYNYEVHDKWTWFYTNAYVLLQALDGWDRRKYKYIVNVENSNWNTGFNEKCFLNSIVVQNLAEVAGWKQQMLESGYTIVHEENNWFMVAPSADRMWSAHLLVMHRNVERNQLIDDALTYVANRLLEALNPVLANLGSSEVLTVEQLSVYEPEIATLSDWLAKLQKLEADEIAVREERKANASKIADEITDKFIAQLTEQAEPNVKGRQLPLYNGNRKDQLEQEIANFREKIKDYTKEITQYYIAIENKEREYMSILCGKDDDFDNLVAVLNKMLANDSPLKYYNLIKGKLELFFVNPITYWEEDEIDQWHNTEQGSKWIDLITSKRFQVMTACKVVVSQSVQGTTVNLDGSGMQSTIHSFVENQVISGSSDEDYMWNRINEYFSSKSIMLDSYRGHYVKQPHIARFSCFGNNEHSIIEAFRNRNYDLGMSIIVHCVTQLNLTDGTVVRTLFDFLEDANYRDEACIWDTETQQYLTPSDALDMFNSSKEVASNETN